MLSALKENLQRKLDVLKEYKGRNNELVARLDLEELICTSDELVPFVHALIDQGKILPKTLQMLYNDHGVAPYLKELEVRTFTRPKFYNEDLENRFHLHRVFHDLANYSGHL